MGSLLVFHPDCGGLLQWVDRSQRQFYTCDKCETRVSSRDQQRIINDFQRPGKWRPLDPDPLHPPAPDPEEELQFDNRFSPFQKAFFPNLAAIQASSKADLLEKARKRGIPQEAAVAYSEWRSMGRERQAPTETRIPLI